MAEIGPPKMDILKVYDGNIFIVVRTQALLLKKSHFIRAQEIRVPRQILVQGYEDLPILHQCILASELY